MRRAAVPGLLLALLAAVFAADPPTTPDAFRPAGTAADLDPAQCASFRGQARLAADADTVATVLGVSGRGKPQWGSPPRKDTEPDAPVRFLIAFRAEKPVGSVLVPAGFELRVLKPGHEGNPDPFADAAWVAAPAPGSQSGGALVPLPAGTRTRAVLLTAPAGQAHELRAVRLYAERLHNSVPHALAYADREYRPPNTQFNPWPASHITSGKGTWVNVGKDNTGFIPAPPVTEINPSWFLLAWPAEQTVEGLWLVSDVEKYDVSYFAGPDTVNPRTGTPEEWRKLKDVTDTAVEVGEKQTARWIKFPKPVRTRGLKLTITRTSEGPVAAIRGLHALTKLGDKPVPLPPAGADEPPPFRIPYTLAADGIVSMGVNGPDGRRVRNLFARAETKAGEHAAGWDLKDADGNFVAPGTYRWVALAGPELRAKYEMTVYPNVESHAPDNSPWLNGADGPGGWMADHTPPSAGCAAGDRVFLGSQVAESGVSLIEVDTDGKKSWGHHSFAAWTGARFLASDGKEVFAGMQVLGTPTDAVWGIDLKTHKVRTVFQLNPTASRARGMQGLAARDGKLYVSVKGADAWLAGAAAGEDADLPACVPLYPTRRQPRFAYEVPPDPQGDFVRLFRLTGSPPGGSTSSTLAYIETEPGTKARQHVVLAFKKPVPIGSAVFPLPAEPDVKVVLSTLKPGTPYPPSVDDNSQWQPWSGEGKRPWDVVAAPANTSTRAVRVTFVKGGKTGDDPLDGTLDGPKAKADFPDPDKPKPGGSGLLEFGGNARWKGRLEGLKLLRRRFENAAGEATVRVSSGKVAADGTWDAKRTTPLIEADPGIYLLEWKEPQKLRGLAVKEIDGELTRVDVFTGPAGTTPELSKMDGWQTVAEYRQPRREFYHPSEGHNSQARYLDGYIDFGKEVSTRAVRLRVVKQWADQGNQGTMGIRADQGGRTIDPTRCRVFGVAALRYVGGEPPVEAASAERIDVHDAATGKVVKELPVPNAGEIAFDPAGNLHAIQGTKVVKVDTNTGEHRPVVNDLEAPTDLAFDKAGHLYVFDGGKGRQNVRVYDPSGKYLRSVGTPGGFVAGPWDPTRMGQVTAIDIDAKGQLWCVETQYYPKRVTVWNPDGSFRKELLGNTPYGGGGALDPQDKRRLFHGPLEFEIDWKTGRSKLRNLTYVGDAPPADRPIRVNGRTYLVTRPYIHTMECGCVYRYENGKAIPAAAMGRAAAFDPLKRPEVSVKFGGKALTDYRFIWCDRNGDGAVQAEEVTLIPIGKFHSVSNFNLDLGVQGGNLRYEVKEFLPNGVPVYEEKELPALKGGYLYRLANGTFYRMGSDGLFEGALEPDGTVLWTYPQEGNPGTHALEHARPYTPDQIVSQFMIVGHETAAGGLGEFVVCNTNVGCWNVWSADGLLAGTLFRDFRSGRSRPWSMRDHARGTVWEDLTVGQEHFNGYLCKAEDKFYAVAGHNHASVMEVLGLDQYVRLGGEVTVTPEALAAAREWETRKQSAAVYARAPVMDVYRLAKPPAMDGKLTGFGPASASFEGPRQGTGASLHMAYDDKYLYVGYSTGGMGPLKNAGTEFERLFKTGAAVDLYLETDPKADPARKAPVAGDVRLLITQTPAGPRAVLYRPVVPGTPPEKAWRVRSPVGEVAIDEVKLVPGVRIGRNGEADRYVLEAAVPLAELGLKPTPGMRLKLDWGVLVSGPEGTEVLKRVYWANQSAQIVADAPSEARLSPHLWGHALFHGARGDDTRLDAATGGKKPDRDVTDILDDLKGPKK